MMQCHYRVNVIEILLKMVSGEDSILNSVDSELSDLHFFPVRFTSSWAAPGNFGNLN